MLARRVLKWDWLVMGMTLDMVAVATAVVVGGDIAWEVVSWDSWRVWWWCWRDEMSWAAQFRARADNDDIELRGQYVLQPSLLHERSRIREARRISNMASPSTSSLLSLPQELRDLIFSYLFLPATYTTEHPFPQCLPSDPKRFTAYRAIRLVNRALSTDAQSYFIKHISPQITFYFTSTTELRHFQHRVQHRHPFLQHSNFHIRCGSGVGRSYRLSTRVQTRAESEEVESLIRIQPGFRWWMDELPGFYRSRPATLTNYGYFPATGPAAWKPSKFGVVVFEQTGGEVCDSERCARRTRRQDLIGDVTEVQFPPLSPPHASSTPATSEGSGREVASLPGGPLKLSCYIWSPETNGRMHPLGPQVGDRSEVAIMVLQGKLRDVWVPENVVEVALKQRRERMR